MKTMRENNSLYLYQPGGDELAVIKITVVNDSGIPGRVSDLKDLLETGKSVCFCTTANRELSRAQKRA